MKYVESEWDFGNLFIDQLTTITIYRLSWEDAKRAYHKVKTYNFIFYY